MTEAEICDASEVASMGREIALPKNTVVRMWGHSGEVVVRKEAGMTLCEHFITGNRMAKAQDSTGQ